MKLLLLNSSSLLTLQTARAQPAQIIIRNIGTNSVDFTWGEITNLNFNNYILSLDGAQIQASARDDNRLHTFSGLTPGTRYTLRVSTDTTSTNRPEGQTEFFTSKSSAVFGEKVEIWGSFMTVIVHLYSFST